MRTKHLTLALAATLGVSLTLSVRAEEGGSGHHILGTAGSLAGILPDKPGFTIKNSFWGYNGDASAARDLSIPVTIGGLADRGVFDGIGTLVGGAAGSGKIPPAAGLALGAFLQSGIGQRVLGKQFTLGGQMDISVDSKARIDTLSFIYTTPWKLFGGTYSVAVALPLLSVETNVNLNAQVAGKEVHVRQSASSFGISDIVVVPGMIGWHNGYWHWMTGLNIYCPTGDYSPSDLAPLGKNFWTFEPVAGLTYLNEKYGQEVSLLTGLDFNTKNQDTDYQTGTQWFIEGLISQHLPGGFAVGATAFYYRQIADDSGSGAAFGGFRAESFAWGPSLQYITKIKGRDLAMDVKWLHETNAVNRIKGNAIWLNVSISL